MSIWYHGSNMRFELLREGSTITPIPELAEAFSHKPSILCIEDDGDILHNGLDAGFLYIIDEEICIGADCVPHPRTTMRVGDEYLTKRALKVRLYKKCELSAEYIQEAARRIEAYMSEWVNAI